jgi:hypothetical protein
MHGAQTASIATGRLDVCGEKAMAFCCHSLSCFTLSYPFPASHAGDTVNLIKDFHTCRLISAYA